MVKRKKNLVMNTSVNKNMQTIISVERKSRNVRENCFISLTRLGKRAKEHETPFPYRPQAIRNYYADFLSIRMKYVFK